ncbi:MAG: ABC transporter substrate-binding protein [Dehalococcoidia bacterium]|nr:ABC transporter substrate-binding protein [Dehalococcoidia bacterium]
MNPEQLPVIAGGRVSRRRFLAGMGGAAFAAAFVAACGDGDDPAVTSTPTEAGSPAPAGSGSNPTASASPTGEAGAFTFTDDRGVTVDLPAVPTRIVAQADSAAALADLGIMPIATFGEALPADTPSLASRGLGDMESVGEVWAEIDLEKLASLNPDLVVTRLYPSTDPPIVWGIADEAIATIEQIAPIVTIDMLKITTHGMERFAELAQALGANPDAPELVADLEHFEAASEAVRAAAAAKPGLTVLGMSLTPDNVYLAVPTDHPDIAYFEELGVQFVVPETADPTWATISPEQIGRYPADILFIDARGTGAGRPSWDAFEANPLAASLPAAQAGQLLEWHAAPIPSYRDFARNLDDLAAAIDSASPDVVA